MLHAGEAEIALRLDGSVVPVGNHSSLVTRHSSLDGEAARSGFTVYALGIDGKRKRKVPVTFDPATGFLRFTASSRQPFGGCLYYEVVR
jgi:hypothetical protein